MKQAATNFVLLILRGYKWALSPFLLPACRYVPTCSEYAIEAVDRYGVLRGGTMALGRVLRCHPFVRGGYDPVVKASHSNFMMNFNSSVRPNASPAHSVVNQCRIANCSVADRTVTE